MIHLIKERIEAQIICSTSWNMSNEGKSYLTGLADALEIVERVERDQLVVGKDYYVLVWNESNRSTDIQIRTLTKITHTITRTAYCFSLGRHDESPIVLYSKGGLANRVFNTYEDAERGKQHVYLDQKRQY